MSSFDLYEPIKNYLSRNEAFYVDLLRQMVKINSFTLNKVGVNKLGQLTAEMFSDLGFYSEAIKSVHPMYGNHIVLTKTGYSGRKIGLVSHCRPRSSKS